MSRIYFADEATLDRTISEYRGVLDRLRPEKKRGIELSLTGLGIKYEQQDKYLPLTLIEKIDLLKSLLEADKAVATNRPTVREDSRPYVLECCRAARVVVPEVAVNAVVKPAFSFWLSPRTETSGQLCLMEGNGSDADNPFNYAQASTFTVLQSLVHFARQQGRVGELDLHIPNEHHPNPHAKVNDTHPPSLINQFHNVRLFAYDFFNDPESVLEKWGCEISTGTDIMTLYRVREYGPDAASNWQLVSTFGYAIAIEGVIDKQT